ncbi:MAG: class I SAM-dependent methyltransferase [Candidatus Odinarchaeota archaeon]
MPVDPAVIKKIVRENFNKSAELYEQFEEEYGLFSFLTVQLAESCDVQKGMKVADIGCGTGISCFILQNIVGTEGTVTGVDPSEKMLEIAVSKLKNTENSRMKFVHGDGSNFNTLIDSTMNAVLYNATIFLIPDPLETLKVAHETLEENGIVGMNYLMGLYSDDTEKAGDSGPITDLFLQAKQAGKDFAPYGRIITDGKVLPRVLVEIGFKNIREGILVKKMAVDEMKAFYSIPAQSAGLWPRHDYEERLSLLDSLVEYFQEKGISAYYQNWGWCSAIKM